MPEDAGDAVHYLCRAARGFMWLCCDGARTNGLGVSEQQGGRAMKLGVCAPFGEVAGLRDVPFDYLEESVQRFLMPERPR